MNKIIISDLAPWVVTAALCIVMGYLVTCIPACIRSWTRPGRRTALFFLLVSVSIAAFVRFAWVPNTRRIYFDEDRYLMYAVSFARTGQELGIRLATPTKVLLGDPDPGARVTVPTLHAWIMRLFGYNDTPLFTAAKVASTIQILLLFALSFLLFGSPVGAIVAACIYALLPITAYWSVTTNLDSYFVFFGMLAAIAALWYVKRPSLARSIFLCATITLLLFVRIEGLAFIPILVIAIVLRRREIRAPLLQRSDIFAIAFTALLLGMRLFIALPLFSQTWCCAEATPLEIFQIGYVARNIIPNIQTFVMQPEFPAILSLLAFVTLFLPYEWTKKRLPSLSGSARWMLVLWILFYFVIYSCYYAGQFYSFTFSGSYGRFFLVLVPPIVLLAAFGLTRIGNVFVTANNKSKIRMLGVALIVGLTLYPTIINYQTMIRISPWDALVDMGPRISRTQLTQNILPNIPRSAILIHPLTAAPLMDGRTIVAYEAFLSSPQAQSYVKQKLKEGVQVYILHTNTCDSTPYKCAGLRGTFTFVPTPLGQDTTQTIVGIDQVKLVH